MSIVRMGTILIHIRFRLRRINRRRKRRRKTRKIIVWIEYHGNGMVVARM